MTEQDKVTVDDIIGIVKTEEQTNSVEEVRKLRGRETMAGKRFTIDVETENVVYAYFENDNFLCYEDDYDSILQKMNDLADEYNHLKEENEQLKNICRNLISEVNKRGITVTMTDNCRELLE